MNKLLQLYRVPRNNLFILTDDEPINYTQFVAFLNKLFDPSTRNIHLKDVFGNKQNFFFVGDATGASLKDPAFESRFGDKQFLIQQLGFKNCYLHQLPSLEKTNYNGFVLNQCASKGNFYISISRSCGLENKPKSFFVFEKCGNEKFVAEILSGLQGVETLIFLDCGSQEFYLQNSLSLSTVTELKFEYCGFEKFYVHADGFTNLRKLSFYKSGLDKFSIHEPNNYKTVEYLSMINCGTDGEGMIISNTKGFQNLQTLHMIKCGLNSKLVITDVSFFLKLKNLTISNCGFQDGIIIEDVKTLLPLDKAFLLLNAIDEVPNGKEADQPGIIKIRTQLPFQTKLSNQEYQYQRLYEQKFNRVKDKLISKGWDIDIIVQ